MKDPYFRDYVRHAFNKVALYPRHNIENYLFLKNFEMIALFVTACRFFLTFQVEMNRRPIGNASKSAVIDFRVFWTNGRTSKLFWKKSTLDIKTCHFMELV